MTFTGDTSEESKKKDQHQISNNYECIHLFFSKTNVLNLHVYNT